MAQTIQYFLGANSAAGFCSFYDTLFLDPRVRQVWIIKGGPGNGKSTLMRAIGAAASARGKLTEEILCSSDPDSLDGIIIPAIGLAVVDGTAPHVVEPILCGMESRYLDLSACYRPGMDTARAEIMQAMTANKRSYPTAYACLNAAGILRRRAGEQAMLCVDGGALKRLAESLIETELPPRDHPGSDLRRFFKGFTPHGILIGKTSIQSLCSRIYAFSDRYGISDDLLKTLQKAALSRGYDCVTGHDPLMPEQVAQLLIPELSLAFVRTERNTRFAESDYCRITLDVHVQMHEAEREHTHFLLTTAGDLEQEAVAHLKQAKTHHDRLEQLCKPYVDFDAVTRLRDRYLEQVNAMLDAAE